MRLVTQNLKTYLCNISYLSDTGIILVWNLVPFCVLAFFFISFLKWTIFGVGICLFLYECSSLLILYYRIHKPLVHFKFKNNSIPLSNELWEHTKHTIKMVLSQLPTYAFWVSIQFILFMASNTKHKSKHKWVEIRAYGNLYSLILLINSLNVRLNFFFIYLICFLDRTKCAYSNGNELLHWTYS